MESIRASRVRKREHGIRQRRYWEHEIRDDGDLERHVAYVHRNPVKHGLVAQSVDWPYSSIHRTFGEGVSRRPGDTSDDSRWATAVMLGFAGLSSTYMFDLMQACANSVYSAVGLLQNGRAE